MIFSGLILDLEEMAVVSPTARSAISKIMHFVKKGFSIGH